MTKLGSVSKATQSLYLNENAWDFYKVQASGARLSDIQNPGDEVVTDPIVIF